jgi:response regulator of citrate/malate metabolism
VLVVEDDPHVARLHARLVNAVPGFVTVATATNGDEAERLTERHEPHLAIVDLSIPGADGVTYLRRLRAQERATEAIVVTAVRDAAVVREVMHLGIVDYLVKPFAPDRLQHSLVAFLARARTLRRQQLTQDDVDRIQASGAARLYRLPKGLKRSTLAAVRRTVAGSDRALTAAESASRASPRGGISSTWT